MLEEIKTIADLVENLGGDAKHILLVYIAYLFFVVLAKNTALTIILCTLLISIKKIVLGTQLAKNLQERAGLGSMDLEESDYKRIHEIFEKGLKS